MSVKSTTEVDQLEDDLFAAGFDEMLGSPEDTSDDETSSDEEDGEGVCEQEAPADETPAEQEASVEKAQSEEPAKIDVKAIVAEALAAAKANEPDPKVDEQKPVEKAVEKAVEKSAEELQAEEDFKRDWPEHAAREERLKRELEEMKQLLNTTVEKLTGQIAPVLAQSQQSAEEKHLNTILSAHSDAMQLVPEVQEWVKKQPKFLQPQYEAVLDNGSAADVVELFTMFKEATGKNQVNQKPAEDSQKKAERESKLERMKTPASVRTSVTAEEDPDDFDAAFEQAAKKLAA